MRTPAPAAGNSQKDTRLLPSSMPAVNDLRNRDIAIHLRRAAYSSVRLRSITCANRFQLSVWSKTGKRCRTMLAISIQLNIAGPRQRLLRLCVTLQIVGKIYVNCSCSVPRI